MVGAGRGGGVFFGEIFLSAPLGRYARQEARAPLGLAIKPQTHRATRLKILNVYKYIYGGIHSSLSPHRGSPKLPEFFDTRDHPENSCFFETTALGRRPKSKEILKNIDSTWSGFFFDEKSVKLQWGK